MMRSPSRSTVMTIVGLVAAFSVVGGAAFAAGQLTGKDIKDKTLGPDDLLVRVASKTVDSQAASGVTGRATLVSVTVVAPAKGYLVVSGSSDVYDYSAASTPECWIDLNGRYAFGSDRVMAIEPTTNPEEDCSTAVTIPVAAGKHRVAFRAFLTEATLTFDEATLRAKYVPFNGTGGTPTKAEIKAATGAPVPVARGRVHRDNH